ncbi:MAG: hypothetical protein LBJ96_02720 [Holosporaceae bacterium]|jgi:hypothetical protein|nr:hypothetical protein [Holosporaceae bacterium]
MKKGIFLAGVLFFGVSNGMNPQQTDVDKQHKSGLRVQFILPDEEIVLNMCQNLCAILQSHYNYDPSTRNEARSYLEKANVTIMKGGVFYTCSSEVRDKGVAAFWKHIDGIQDFIARAQDMIVINFEKNRSRRRTAAAAAEVAPAKKDLFTQCGRLADKLAAEAAAEAEVAPAKVVPTKLAAKATVDRVSPKPKASVTKNWFLSKILAASKDRLKKAAAKKARAEAEKARAEKARAEKARAEKARAEKARAEKARAEKARAEKARAEKARAEKARAEKARAEKARAEKARAKRK